ncbi:cold-shock' DNA-binding domain-containing protein [Powellomyces hirtus]|nr:cold-shock' DNA-binding domain-containing protein [Powellomyces hirtus]
MCASYYPTRATGRVKFFNSQKGYGFIVPDVGDVEVFVHHTAIRNAGGFRSLGEEELVEYDVVLGPKGSQAANVSGPNGRPVRGDNRPMRFSRPSYGWNPVSLPLSPPRTPGMSTPHLMSPISPVMGPYSTAATPTMMPAYYNPNGWMPSYTPYGYPSSPPQTMFYYGNYGVPTSQSTYLPDMGDGSRSYGNHQRSRRNSNAGGRAMRGAYGEQPDAGRK